MISILPESQNDHDAIRRVITDAFKESEFGHNGEADLVDQLRSCCDEALSLVAFDGDEVVGHPQYYPRFGFQPAAHYGISHGFAGIPQDVLFINFLDSNVIDSVRGADLTYRPEFGGQHEGAEIG